MAHPSRDWRSESPRGYGRGQQPRGRDDNRYRRDANRWSEDDDFGRSAEGIGDYGAYGDEHSYGGEGGRERSEYRYGSRGGNAAEFERGWREDNEAGGRGYFGSQGGPDYGRAYGSARSEFGGNRDYLGEQEEQRGRGSEFGRRDYVGSFGAGRSGQNLRQDFDRGYGSQQGSGYGSPAGYGYGRGEDSTRRFSGGSGYGESQAWGDRGDYRSGGYGGSNSGRDWQGSASSHRGKGPKGYERSDERLKEMICERLSDDPDIDASEISLTVAGGVVKLTGSVDSRAEKYQVEELIERCGGVKDIDNQLRTQSRQQGQLGSGQSSQQGRQVGTSGNVGLGSSGTESTSGTTSSAPSTRKQ